MTYFEHDNPLYMPHLVFTRTAEESKALNSIDRPVVIISASGMADAGRIKYHLKHNLWRTESSILFVGYQAEGSLGRRLVEGVKKVRILGEEISVKAKIYNLGYVTVEPAVQQFMDYLSGLEALYRNYRGRLERAEGTIQFVYEHLLIGFFKIVVAI